MRPANRRHPALVSVLTAGLSAAACPAAAEPGSGSTDDAAARLARIEAANPEWTSEAEAALPAGWTLGRLYRIDASAGKALFAAFPTGADSPWTPGNAFDPGQTVEVRLIHRDNRFRVSGVSVYTRSPDDRARSKNEDHHAGILAELYGRAEAEAAAGITVCRLRGWALSESKQGTAVRSKPSDGATVIGRLPPPYPSEDTAEKTAFRDGWRAEFEITGYKDGWFRIGKAIPPGSPYGDGPSKDFPRRFSGAGWVRVTEVTGAYSDTRMPVARLLQYPHVDAHDFAPASYVSDGAGNLSIDGTLMRLHACSANWALTTSRDGARGWWRGICSNQAPNCT